MQADKAGDRPKLKVCVEESVQGQELGRERQSVSGTLKTLQSID